MPIDCPKSPQVSGDNWQIARTAALTFVGCSLGARAGTLMTFPGVGAAVLFPPYAVLAAALVLTPMRQWWLYVLAAAAGNFWPHLAHERLTSFVLSTECANVLRALIAAVGLRWFGESSKLFQTLKGTVVFLVFAVILGPAVGAVAGASAVIVRNPAANFAMVWQAWFLSNALTGLTLLPLILMICTGTLWRNLRRSPRWIVEGIGLSLAVLAVGAIVFTGTLTGRFVPASLYAPLPLLLWTAVRFRPGAMVTALAALTALSIAGALKGRGPFAGAAPADSLIQLQLFLIALCIPSLLLAAIVQQQAQMAEALGRSEANYRAVVEDQTELIRRFLPDGTLTFVNGAYCRYLHRTPEELLGRTFWEFIPPESHASIRASLASIVPNHPIATVEYKVATPCGELRFKQWTNHGFFDEQGRISDYQAIGRDVTERKVAETSLQSAMDELKRLKDRLEAHNAYLQEELTASETSGDLICRSQMMRTTLAQMQRVAQTDTTVLILGETGVGKEVLARAIQRASHRSDRPFVRLNCAALPPHLIESELFGHERGAFTGATSRRLGRFEVADGATLFLDEVGELPLELQAKLLRVLQEEEFERLGSSTTIKIDVRLIAATSRDLAACVHQGTFRADLYYRLNVFPITVPPLRARREDIIPLASAFLAEARRRLGREFAPISNGVAEVLLAHDWPGNVRELENVIERAAISSQGLVLELPPGWADCVQSIARSVPDQPALTVHTADANTHERATFKVLPTIHEVERNHVLAALEESKWRIEGPRGAASILGMKPSTLRFRMKKLEITRTN